MAGDATGIFRGLVPALLSGHITASDIMKRELNKGELQ